MDHTQPDNYSPERVMEGDINLTSARGDWVENRDLDERTKELLDRDAKCFIHQSMSTPCLDVLKTL